MDRVRNLMQSGIRCLQLVPFEAAFWAVGLAGVVTMDPEAGVGVNLCLIENVGLFCPGEGLGRAIAYLARGNFAASWSAHPLAGPVVLVLLSHIVTLCQKEWRSVGQTAGARSSSHPSTSVSS